MKKVGMVSLGCSKNLVDSENILGLLQEDYQIVADPKQADIIFVNTCGFINDSKKESIDTIFEMLSYGKQVVVTGCLAQRYEKALRKEIPEVSEFITIDNYDKFLDFLSHVDPELNKSGGLDTSKRVVSTGYVSAYLKIGEGCDNRCSYCAIPLIRGGFVSRPKDDIIKEAKHLANNGFKELVILQQDTTKYGVDLKHGENIVDLLKELLKIKEFAYIRLLYLYPDEITDELIDLIASEPRLTPYFDIPIQHSENHILKSMYRRGDKAFLRRLFEKIRKKIPNAILRSTVMVGFPGESKKDFDNLKKFVSEIKFDHLGAFAYSREEDTPSYDLPHQVRESTKKTRLDELMKLQQTISYRKNKSHVGETMEGLIVGIKGKDYLFRSYFNAPDDVDGYIFVTSKKPLQIGSKVKVKITESFVYDLMGEVIID